MTIKMRVNRFCVFLLLGCLCAAPVALRAEERVQIYLMPRAGVMLNVKNIGPANLLIGLEDSFTFKAEGRLTLSLLPFSPFMSVGGRAASAKDMQLYTAAGLSVGLLGPLRGFAQVTLYPFAKASTWTLQMGLALAF